MKLFILLFAYCVIELQTQQCGGPSNPTFQVQNRFQQTTMTVDQNGVCTLSDYVIGSSSILTYIANTTAQLNQMTQQVVLMENIVALYPSNPRIVVSFKGQPHQYMGANTGQPLGGAFDFKTNFPHTPAVVLGMQNLNPSNYDDYSASLSLVTRTYALYNAYSSDYQNEWRWFFMAIESNPTGGTWVLPTGQNIYSGTTGPIVSPAQIFLPPSFVNPPAIFQTLQNIGGTPTYSNLAGVPRSDKFYAIFDTSSPGILNYIAMDLGTYSTGRYTFLVDQETVAYCSSYNPSSYVIPTQYGCTYVYKNPPFPYAPIAAFVEARWPTTYTASWSYTPRVYQVDDTQLYFATNAAPTFTHFNVLLVWDNRAPN